MAADDDKARQTEVLTTARSSYRGNTLFLARDCGRLSAPNENVDVFSCGRKGLTMNDLRGTAF